MTDPEVIALCLSGDVQRFRLLVERYHRRVAGMAFNMTRDHHLSEDLAQEVFVEVYRRLPDFDPARGQFSTWLFRIAQNRTLNALKRKRPLLDPTLAESQSTTDARDDIELNELHAELDRALAALPPNQRIAFVWAEIEQLSYEEVADIGGTSVSAVKSRINRARQAVQAALARRNIILHEHS